MSEEGTNINDCESTPGAYVLNKHEFTERGFRDFVAALMFFKIFVRLTTAEDAAKFAYVAAESLVEERKRHDNDS